MLRRDLGQEYIHSRHAKGVYYIVGAAILMSFLIVKKRAESNVFIECQNWIRINNKDSQTWHWTQYVILFHIMS